MHVSSVGQVIDELWIVKMCVLIWNACARTRDMCTCNSIHVTLINHACQMPQARSRYMRASHMCTAKLEVVSCLCSLWAAWCCTKHLTGNARPHRNDSAHVEPYSTAGLLLTTHAGPPGVHGGRAPHGVVPAPAGGLQPTAASAPVQQQPRVTGKCIRFLKVGRCVQHVTLTPLSCNLSC